MQLKAVWYSILIDIQSTMNFITTLMVRRSGYLISIESAI